MIFDFVEAERQLDEMERSVGASLDAAQAIAKANAKAIYDDFLAFLRGKGVTTVSGALASTSISFVDDWKRFEVEANLDGSFTYQDESKKPGFTPVVRPGDNDVDAGLLMQALLQWSRRR